LKLSCKYFNFVTYLIEVEGTKTPVVSLRCAK
jgi:hypothetical protein